MSDQIGIIRSQIIEEIKTYNILLQLQQEEQRQRKRHQKSQVPMHGKLFIKKSFFFMVEFILK